jgi:hypothetical protein
MSGLTEWLKSIEPWEEDFPDVDAGLTTLDEPDLLEFGADNTSETGAPEAARPRSPL